MILYEQQRSTGNDYIYRQFDENLNFQLHFHNSFELILCQKGVVIITLDRNTYELSEGESLLILPNQVHSYATRTYSKTFILIFASTYVSKFYKKSLLQCATDPKITLSDNAFIQQIQSEENVYLLKSLLYYVIFLYTQKEQINRDIKYTSLMCSILNYVDEHYAENISLLSLSKELGYDYNYISSIFNARFSTNFLDYVNTYRINKACEIIEQEKEYSIYELASIVGYSSLRTFHRNFRKMKQISPLEYIKNLKSANIQTA